MPRVTKQAAAARRERVEALWLRGASTTAISHAVGCEWRTARRDLVLLGTQAAKETDLARELHRLLAAAKTVEAAAWQADQLGQVLAAQKQVLGVLQALLGLDVARRVEALEQRLDDLTAGATGHGVALNGSVDRSGGAP